jgi:hypothetical protein
MNPFPEGLMSFMPRALNCSSVCGDRTIPSGSTFILAREVAEEFGGASAGFDF